ncbi:glycoside hydrolase family 15 protein [Paenibacillus sp. GCM10023248]|uniref:glycoside hydrolase family 15 protein n=1 Tax=Bacillales TaxID=1385 RepID=UPI002377F606|nr:MULTISPECIES: glycoside hydrolase family 15 protein [Bacillales]MDD9268651.1 glycoside hydrolase family 15 protein [Paenibacillus sp. MAHUQ-63]MDR6880115.1 GH15 family glucan-1,4-alpha-glucosidase [Bacillus sp. 3255]
MQHEDLIQRSITIITSNQHPRGGYIASPLFPPYAYSWLRDGTFIANSMDRAGEPASAELFYDWVAGVLKNKRPQVDSLLHKHEHKQWIDRSEFLGTRYHLDGRDDVSEWGHFQLDGYGAYLWGLTEHVKRTGNRDLLAKWRESIEITVDYLMAFWHYPNFDCWEEFPDYVHPATLACVYGGLRALGELEERQPLLEKAALIQDFILRHSVHDGRFVKSIQCVDELWKPVLTGVDASLIWLAVPFGVCQADDPLMVKTVETIENDLKHEGIQRYVEDRYYGGGEWLILTAWYGWYQQALGNRSEAQRCLDWIASKADSLGRLPEQVADSLRAPEAYPEWIAKWGEPALPLLWSHAMYLVLSDSLS